MGLGHLDREQQNIILQRIYDALQTRIGAIVAESLTANQTETFSELIDTNDEAAQAFLERAIPDYAVVVRAELDAVTTHVARRLREAAASRRIPGTDD